MGRPTRRAFLGGGLATLGAGLLARHAEAAEGAAPATGSPAEAGVDVTLTVNGAKHTLRVDPDEVLLDTVRDRLDLTGAKRVCGHGVCGACTMLVDGVPKVTCVLPTVKAHHAAITTVEHVGAQGLHPVQKAVIAHDALQCGYCTPGFVVEGAAFHDRWRARHGTKPPSRDEVADALAGHLCRCGAHAHLLAAVAAACAGQHDGTTFEPPRVDAPEKVTGAARYTTDVRLPGMLEAAVLRSPHAHATLAGTDESEARKVPGFKAITWYVKPGGEVRYAGQEVAAIAAADRRSAEEAVRRLGVTWHLLPAAVGVERARAPEAPLVYRTRNQAKGAPSSSEGPTFGGGLDGNLRGPTRIPFARPGGADRLLAQARAAGDPVVDATWNTQTQSHTALEPHAAVARWLPDGGLEVHASTQSCTASADGLAELYELKRSQVRVLCPFVGGGFGAKALVQMEYRIACDLARLAGAPVRCVLDRASEIGVAGLRPGVRIDLALAAGHDASLQALKATAWTDGGTSAGGFSAALMRLLYPTPFKDLADYDVLNHTPPGKPFRGPAGPPALWALEQAVDEVALKLGKDPIDLRRGWDRHPNRARLYDAAAALPMWKDRADHPGADTGRHRRGVGLAAAVWLPLVSRGVEVRIDAFKGGIVAASACQDMGNGSKSVVAGAVAAVLGLHPAQITVRFGDSDDPVGAMSGGSRTTVSMAPAATVAAEHLRDALVDAAEIHLGLTGAKPIPGGVRHGKRTVTWADVLAHCPPITVVGRRPRDPGGYFLPFGFSGTWIFKRLSAGVQVTEVEVDTRLGIVRPLRSWTGIASGHVHVPLLARSQVEGGVIQGLSYALYEDRRLDPATGRLLSHGLETYRIAGVGDVPEMDVHFDEKGYEGVRGGGIGLSELATVGVAASVGNAVHHATGRRFRRIPLTPRIVLGGLS